MALLAGCKLPPATPVSTAGTVIFSDFFDDNTNKWPAIHNDSVDIKILADEYQFNLTGKSKKAGQVVWKAIDIDTDTIVSTTSSSTGSVVNFRIETDFRYINGDTLTPFGLVFGLSDVNNYEFFGIEKCGAYVIGKCVDGVFTADVSAAQTKLNTGYNHLKVEKNGSNGVNFIYYINGTSVSTSHMPATFGKTFGFYATGDVSMAVDNVKVTTGFTSK